MSETFKLWNQIIYFHRLIALLTSFMKPNLFTLSGFPRFDLEIKVEQRKDEWDTKAMMVQLQAWTSLRHHAWLELHATPTTGTVDQPPPHAVLGTENEAVGLKRTIRTSSGWTRPSLKCTSLLKVYTTRCFRWRDFVVRFTGQVVQVGHLRLSLGIYRWPSFFGFNK